MAVSASGLMTMAQRSDETAGQRTGKDVPGAVHRFLDNDGYDDTGQQGPDLAGPAKENRRHGGEERRQHEISAEPLGIAEQLPENAASGGCANPEEPEDEPATEDEGR